MVVASAGWMQNSNNYSGNQSNNSIDVRTATEQQQQQQQQGEKKMMAKGILICRDNSHPFQERTLQLDQPMKIGRSVARAKPATNNAIFDCKVLSRNHAVLWYEGGKFYLQDTKSSNGTFVNNHKLTSTSLNTAREVCSGDIVQFGVDVMENSKKVTHGCIIATLKLFLPDGKEAKASPVMYNPISGGNVSYQDMYKLYQLLEEAGRREKSLNSKLIYLQQLVENTQKAANQSWRALIDEDRLLTYIETVEKKLAVYSRNYTEDKVRNELAKMHDEKEEYQRLAKESTQKIIQEKLEIAQKLVHLENRLSETEEECQSLHMVVKHEQDELQELAAKYQEVSNKLQESTMELMESRDKVAELEQNEQQEKDNFPAKLAESVKAERSFFSLYIHKQITALRNYLLIIQDMNCKTSAETTQSKDDINPIEAIDTILNKLNDFYTETGDNEINWQELHSTYQNKKQQDDLESDKPAYILPPSPPCKERLALLKRIFDEEEGSNQIKEEQALLDCTSNTTVNNEDDTISVASDDTCINEKSSADISKDDSFNDGSDDDSFDSVKAAAVRFNIPEKDESPTEKEKMDDNVKVEGSPTDENRLDGEEKQEVDGEVAERSTNKEQFEEDYVKTLKPQVKCEPVSDESSVNSRDYLLQTLITSLDSLKESGEAEWRAHRAVKTEIERLKEWLVLTSNDSIVEKLGAMYNEAQSEVQRVNEVREELAILKEKCNVFAEEKAELFKQYTTLKAQCGDLCTASYSVPVQYVAPLVLALLWIFFGKIF